MNIILSGFMGSGKTTLAECLASKLDMRFIDLDGYIEQTNGISVSDIIEQRGENGYRDCESKAVAELSALDNCVIAIGGGTIINSANVKLLKQSGIIIYLDVTVETVLRRMQSGNYRPAFNTSENENAIKQLLSGRLPIYKAVADYSIDANDDDVERKAVKIIDGLRLK